MKPEEALAWLESRPDITSLRAAVCDLNGILRGKRVPVAQAGKVLEGATRMPYSITCLDIWGEDVKGNPLVFQHGANEIANDLFVFDDQNCLEIVRLFHRHRWGLGVIDGIEDHRQIDFESTARAWFALD